MPAKILAICRSVKKGTQKDPIKEGMLLTDFGLQGDAHADSTWHRQVSLLANESVEKMRKLGADVGPGAFAENLLTEGIELVSLPIGTRLTVGKDVVLEVTQIGKECHAHCAIYQQVGTCVMPTEGIFTRVIKGGRVAPGDTINKQ
ncbi:MAG: MOSC domain-containing protein [Dehalococcoidales bacterium]|nr:MOSC domain-containing protein [Dehalococcoidales bacterium]